MHSPQRSTVGVKLIGSKSAGHDVRFEMGLVLLQSRVVVRQWPTKLACFLGPFLHPWSNDAALLGSNLFRITRESYNGFQTGLGFSRTVSLLAEST